MILIRLGRAIEPHGGVLILKLLQNSNFIPSARMRETSIGNEMKTFLKIQMSKVAFKTAVLHVKVNEMY